MASAFLILTMCCLCSRLKSILDKGGVVQEFVDALQQLTNPEMLFKVNIPFPLKYPLVDPVLRCQTHSSCLNRLRFQFVVLLAQ